MTVKAATASMPDFLIRTILKTNTMRLPEISFTNSDKPLNTVFNNGLKFRLGIVK